MTHPIGITASKVNPTKSYLHLFRSADSDERELERLEINEDSVVFIANEDEVSGRRHVVKVGGIDVGVRRKELNQEEGGRTMWFLQICDQSEAQQWIARIKQSIFGQRCACLHMFILISLNPVSELFALVLVPHRLFPLAWSLAAT